MGQVDLIINQPMFLQPSHGLAHMLGRPMTCYGYMIVILFQPGQEVPGFRIRLKLGAVLVLMNGIYRIVKILLSAISFPDVPVFPVFRVGKVRVNFFQFLVKSVTKLPQGIVYVDDCGFLHSDIITYPINVRIHSYVIRSQTDQQGNRRVSMQTKNKSYIIARAGFFIALAAGLAALLSGSGTSYGLWNYRTGLSVLRGSAYGGIAAAAISLIGLIASLRIVIVRGFLWALLGVVMGCLIAGVVLHWKHVAENVPGIHDITTDTENPPQFFTILKLLKSDVNSPVYGGDKVAAQQRKAYPDIVPLILPAPPAQAFESALAVARKLGWQIIDANKNAGRIEAVATTFWFGFNDDIVIRLRQQNSGCRVDIRSESRVGVSDLGKNAERIRQFLRQLKERK